jgi:hypothetical protein
MKVSFEPIVPNAAEFANGGYRVALTTCTLIYSYR